MKAFSYERDAANNGQRRVLSPVSFQGTRHRQWNRKFKNFMFVFIAKNNKIFIRTFLLNIFLNWTIFILIQIHFLLLILLVLIYLCLSCLEQRWKKKTSKEGGEEALLSILVQRVSSQLLFMPWWTFRDKNVLLNILPFFSNFSKRKEKYLGDHQSIPWILKPPSRLQILRKSFLEAFTLFPWRFPKQSFLVSYNRCWNWVTLLL